MSNIVLSTSSSGLDNIAIAHNIELIRLRIYVNNIEFIDGKNITNERLQELMTGFSTSPVRTSPAPAKEVYELFMRLKDQGYQNIFITTLSSVMSKSYSIIKEVAESFKDSLNIYVYDCKELNVCEGLLALEAETLMQKGVSMPEIAARLDSLRASHKMLYAVDDLSYLIRNRKLSVAAGFFANLLKLKPVLTIDDKGATFPIKKIRHFEKALNYVIDDIAPAMRKQNSFAYLLTTGRPEINEQAIQLIKQKTFLSHLAILPVSAISLANHGPVGVGLCIFEGNIPQAADKLMTYKLR